jgi:iron-sulfur cluster assembly protein
MEKFINITPAAVEFIKSSIEDEKCMGIRIDTKYGGCAGMTYEIDFVREINPADILLKDNGIDVYISPRAVIFVENMTMDYVKSSMGGSIVIENPNAKMTCSCGKSFSTNGTGACAEKCF